jgi:hypothetical protein
MEYKMMKKLFFFFFVMILLIGFISSEGVSYCCEKTKTGAWCQNMDSKDKCDTSGELKAVSTSCESTSYCKMGCCFDSKAGTCSQNTAQKTCENNGGTWNENANCEIEQCQEGCCILGNIAFWNTLTACKSYASLYGLEAGFRKDISNEFECITSINLDVKGACVYEEGGIKTCKSATKKECNEIQGTTATTSTTNSSSSSWLSNLFGNNQENTTSVVTNTISSTNFYEGYLCSAEKLATNCAPSQKTTCVEGKDQIYFIDTCGNVANIYDSSKINDKDYWAKIVDEEDSCGYGDSKGNANSATCGNCDYYLGSMCKAFNRGDDKSPKYGDNICKDLSCKYNGQTYKNGETWCATNTDIAKIGEAGSQYFKLSCYNKEVSVELCDSYRNKICSESEINGYRNAQCIVNEWQSCSAQNNKEDCENEDQRDCKWVKISQSSKTKIGNEYCVPKYTPGFDFWTSGTEAGEICSQLSFSCIVKYEEGLLGGGKTCVENCDCLDSIWQKKIAGVCNSIGDCEMEVSKKGSNSTKEVSG